MKKSPKLYLVLGLALLVASLLAIYLTIAVAQWTDNAVLDHRTSGDIPEATCASAGCHQDVVGRSGRDAHNWHMNWSALLAFYDKSASNFDGCGKCHQSTDIREESGATLRKQVHPGKPGEANDTLECLDCHGKFTESAVSDHDLDEYDPANSKYKLDQNNDGLPDGCGLGLNNCHAAPDPMNVAHSGTSYINQPFAQASAFCLKCHGALDKYVAEETN